MRAKAAASSLRSLPAFLLQSMYRSTVDQLTSSAPRRFLSSHVLKSLSIRSCSWPDWIA